MASPKRLGDYDVLLTLASGGMGEVKLARRIGPAGFRKLFAIKVLHPHLAAEPALVESFRREAMLAARVHHPNVAQTFELGEAAPPEHPEPEDPIGPTFFLVMEHVEGESLAALLRAYAERGEIAPWSIAARIVRDAAAGLQAAHDAKSDDGAALGIVHRDVSPPNILVGTDGVSRVVDFGIAKAFAEAASVATGKLRGKLSYMSPEQVRGDPLDGRSDVFSLGAVLYEAVTGIRPFRSEYEMETVKNILEREPPPVTSLVGGVPPALEAVVTAALEKNRDTRCASARELARLLDECLRQTPEPVTDQDVAAEVLRLLGTRIQERRSRIRHALRSLGPQDTTPPSGPVRTAAIAPATELRPETPLPVDGPNDRRSAPDVQSGGVGWRTLVSAVLLVAAGAGGALLAVAGDRTEDDGAPARAASRGTSDPARAGSEGPSRALPPDAPAPAPPVASPATPATGSPAPAPLATASPDAGPTVVSARARSDAAAPTRPRPPSRPASIPGTRPATPPSPRNQRGLRRDDLTF